MKSPSDHDHPSAAQDRDTVVIDVRGDDVREEIRSIERSGYARADVLPRSR